MNINTQNILVVDDEKSNIDILLGFFESINQNDEYNIIAVLSGEKALKVVEKRDIDLILLDIMMSQMDGYEVCKILKSNEKTKDIPILFITANTDDESIEKAYSLGAADYVTKPFRPIELISRVKLNLKLQKTINQLEFMAYYDSLTGVYNRRKFFTLAEKRFAQKRDDLYAVMLDIDKFKSINDTYGHSVGDKVLKEVANVLKNSVDENDILTRLGGEEFAILCNKDSNENAFEFIEDIRKKVENVEITTDDGLIVKCTISEGIAKYTEDLQTLDYLLHKADEALYEAKNTGRNRTIFRI